MVHITVWTLDPETVPGALLPALEGLLDADESARAAQFVYNRHRCEYVAAHALKRTMIPALTGVPAAACRFDILEGGKPVLSHPRGLHFNLSHCEGLVAVATSPETPIGVDVESIRDVTPLDIAPTVFAPAELAWLDALAPAERHEGFVRLWTLKEAFIKATGRGLTEPLDGFAFGFEPLTVTFRDPARSDTKGWRFAERRLTRHRLALAWRGAADASVSVRAVRPEELLDGG